MKPRCLVVMEPKYFPLLFGDTELAHLQSMVRFPSSPLRASDLHAQPARWADVELILASWGMPALDDTLLPLFPKLKALFYAAGSVKSVVGPAFWRRHLRVTNASYANSIPTAEYTFAAIIFSLKRAWTSMAALRGHLPFERYTREISGCYRSTVGLLSLGKIGRAVAQHLTTLDVNVIAYDPYVSPAEADALGVRLCSLDDVFHSADAISCHMPLTDETKQSLGHAHFSAMKRGATFINTARGALVREDELVAVLAARADLFAVLDVMEAEPPRTDSALLALPNVVATPHIAGSIGHECRRMGVMMVDEVRRYLDGDRLQGEVQEKEIPFLA